MSGQGGVGLLLEILRHDAEAPLSRLRDAQWSSLAIAAQRHELAPVLWHRLQEHHASHLPPPDVRKELSERHTLASLRTEARRAQLREMLTALHEHGIPTVLLKGAFLAEFVYPAACLRPMGDLDLLVERGQLPEALEALVAAGYQRPDPEVWQRWERSRTHLHPPPLRRAARLPVELHDVIEPCAAPFALRIDDVWSGVQPLGMPHSSALALAPEDCLIHLAAHMGHSHLLGSSLVRVLDVALWTHRQGVSADWDAIVERSTAGGLRRFTYTALELARRLAGAEVPAEARRALRAETDDAAVDHAMSLIDERGDVLSSAISFTRPDLSLASRLSRAMRVLLIPPRARAGSAGWGPVAQDERRRHDAYRGRWQAIGHLLRHPGAAADSLRRLERIRQLRGWAEGA